MVNPIYIQYIYIYEPQHLSYAHSPPKPDSYKHSYQAWGHAPGQPALKGYGLQLQLIHSSCVEEWALWVVSSSPLTRGNLPTPAWPTQPPAAWPRLFRPQHQESYPKDPWDSSPMVHMTGGLGGGELMWVIAGWLTPWLTPGSM